MEEAAKRLERYIKNTEELFTKIKIFMPEDASIASALKYNISLSKQYLEDAKYYFKNGDYITGIVCIAYCEGILDACRNFGWIRWD
ncbi:MAG: DUF357 domain-containing protein [Candidatus Methanomethyliaceae archaeon]|nr:DUF357 domain-containing protein [Candidatus Methanomethyliaceae archaeon]MCX8170262.1 DUF357 domain-containing protein [Candidatus Methanomethyliaceae archaeon]MDW7971033.1 DUF357 domain-containing protein [Nitrososphaerota archaeon]